MLRSGHSFSGRERNCVFLNCRNEQFANVSAVTGLDFEDDGRALATTDWDHDGDLDVWLLNRTGPRLRFMKNQTIRHSTPAHAQFLSIGLQGTKSNRDAIGARVEVVTDQSNDDRMVATLTAGDAFLSQSSKWLHFGLSDATEVGDEKLAAYAQRMVDNFTDQMNEANPILTEISDAMTDEGKCRDKVRVQKEGPLNQDMKRLQRLQNKMMRTILGVKLRDKVPIKSMLDAAAEQYHKEMQHYNAFHSAAQPEPGINGFQ